MATITLPTQFENVVIKDRGIEGYLPVISENPDANIYLELSVKHTAGRGYSLTLWRTQKTDFGYSISIFEDSRKLIELDCLASNYSTRFNKANLKKLFEEATDVVFKDLPIFMHWASQKQVD